MFVHSHVVWVGAILKYLKKLPIRFLDLCNFTNCRLLVYATGICNDENTKFDCKKDSTPMKVK